MSTFINFVPALLILFLVFGPPVVFGGLNTVKTESDVYSTAGVPEFHKYSSSSSDLGERCTKSTVGGSVVLAQAVDRREESSGTDRRRSGSDSDASTESKSRAIDAKAVWKSDDLDMLAVGIGIGDVDGDGRNEIVIIDPGMVYVYRFDGNKMNRLAEYSAGALELKSLDVAKLRKQGPARIYVSAQNRGQVASFVLEYRNGTLVPIVNDLDYFLRVINYPTVGPILVGQKRSLSKMYDGPVYRMVDKGDAIERESQFGVPLKIPVFGFAIGDFEGKRKPLIAVYDRNDHLRIYAPDGKRLYVSKDFYGGSDVMLRWFGPEHRERSDFLTDEEKELTFFRPRIMALDLNRSSVYEILAITHSSKTMRVLSRTKMLEDGQVKGLFWNGDALEDKWATPKINGLITDFAVDNLPGLQGLRLITLERKKTDWLSFLRSKSQVRAYDIEKLIKEGISKSSREKED